MCRRALTRCSRADLRLKANVEQREEYIDYLNHELAAYISRAVAFETNEQDSAFISALFKASSIWSASATTR